ncbi:MAG: transcription termination/antitermination protein NusG [Pirellulales bacterium]
MIENSHNSSQIRDDAAIDSPTVAPSAPPIGAPAREHESGASSGNVPTGEAAPEEVRAEQGDPAVSESPAAAASARRETGAENPLAEGPVVDEDERVAEEEEVEPRGPIEETPVTEEPVRMNWFILKVQSNREESIRESLQRRVKVAGLERYFGEIIVPTEMVSEFKGGKKRVVKRKLYPGYLVAHMEINDETWFLVRETPGIGDFTGSAGKPTPMQPHEVAKIVAKQEEKTDEAPKLKINFNVGDRVKINEGTFDNFEGEVDCIEEASGRVTVMINIFGRSTPVELEYWQIETI